MNDEFDDFTPSKVTNSLVRSGIEKIDRLLDGIKEYVTTEHKKLSVNADNVEKEKYEREFYYNSYIDMLIEDDIWLDEINILGSQLAIVALYRIIENRTKFILRELYNKEEVKRFYKWNKMKTALLRDHSIKLEDVAYYNEVNELRCLNNDIKHSGKVSKELASFGGLTENEDISDVKEVYERISKLIPEYLTQLHEYILKAKNSK